MSRTNRRERTMNWRDWWVGTAVFYAYVAACFVVLFGVHWLVNQ